jgi:hypothetical protein
MTAEELLVYASQAVDIANGLGRRVLVSGISGGGTIACWLAQNCSEVDIAMPIAAMLGMSFVPAALTKPFTKLLSAIPDYYMWWDPRYKADTPFSIDYAYPGYSTHAMSEVLRLGVGVRKQAKKAPPAASRIVMVLNEAEPGINNSELNNMIQDWKKHENGATYRTYTFEPELKLPHDIITPGTPDLDSEEIYTRLINLIQEETIGDEEDPNDDTSVIFTA